MTWKIQRVDMPWPHIIIDNFFDAVDFNDINEEIDSIKDVLNESPESFSSDVTYNADDLYKYSADSTAHADVFTYPTLIKPYFNLLNKQFLDKHFPNHREIHNDIKSETTTQITERGYYYPKHNNASREVMSAVVYMSGAGAGITIYDSQGNNGSAIRWKLNRAVIFAPLDNITWHSYKANPVCGRATLSHNIIRTGNRPS